MADQKDTVRQIIARIDEILRENPVPLGETSRAVRLVDDDAISILVNCMLEGGELKPHTVRSALPHLADAGTGELAEPDLLGIVSRRHGRRLRRRSRGLE